ncbi:hypothetical protein R9X47_04035 [Wukongibacter baidiensis]|uniref:hypothetical protein n=1 Tax=Wukongibacter baidiensis TaxID=1723361 RepID=UPI003D7F3731
MVIDPALNAIVMMPTDGSNTAIAVASNLFTIESINTTEARIQSTTTTNGNEHTIEKLAIESLIGTRVSQGRVDLVTTTNNNGTVEASILASIQLLPFPN